jgi:hypothetical protein
MQFVSNKTIYKLRIEELSNKCAATDISIRSSGGAGATRTVGNSVGT